MPSGKTHDAITLVLAVPTFAATYVMTRDIWLSAVVAAGFLLGGLMFGPDLDTGSVQFTRWRFLKLLWLPYRLFFRHRSRWTHGLIFGTLLRAVYFMGVATCVAFLAAYVYSVYSDRSAPALLDFARAWSTLSEYSRSTLGASGPIGLFVGMWTGAASHTFTDMAGTYIKTGRVTEFL